MLNKDYQLGDVIRVQGEGVGVLVAVRAAPSSNGSTSMQYRVRLAEGEPRWVSLSDILGRVEAQRRQPFVRLRVRPSKMMRRPSKMRRRPSKMPG